MNANQNRWNELLVELRGEMLDGWKSLGLDTESVARLDFEAQSGFRELRSLDLTALGEPELESLLSSVRGEFSNHLEQLQSEFAATQSAEEARCQKMRIKIASMTAEKKALAAARSDMERKLAPVKKLSAELAQLRSNEKMLVNLCGIKGISPNAVPPNDETSLTS